MKILDANMILRFLVQDNESAADTVAGYEICTFDKKLNHLMKREDEK